MFLPIFDNHPYVGKPRFKISGSYPQILETSFRSKGEPTMKLRREGLLANLYFMKIHHLILKLFTVKETSSLVWRILH